MTLSEAIEKMQGPTNTSHWLHTMAHVKLHSVGRIDESQSADMAGAWRLRLDVQARLHDVGVAAGVRPA